MLRHWADCRGKTAASLEIPCTQYFQVFDESTVQVSNGQLVRIPELGSRLVVGEKGSVRTISLHGDFSAKPFQDIIPPSDSVHNIVNFLLGRSSRPTTSDTVLTVNHSVYAVAWLALNQYVCFQIICICRHPL